MIYPVTSKSSIIRSFILFAIYLIVAAYNTTLYAETGSPMGKMKGDPAVPLIITSEHLNADNKNRIATFTGSVKAVKGDSTLYADKMVVYYTEDQKKVDRIEATGNIRLYKETKTITAEKAVYYGASDSVVFTGSPQANDGKNQIAGTKMTYYIQDDRTVVENSHVVLNEK